LKIEGKKMKMLIDLLNKRYSCRDFDSKEISSDIVEYIIECGRLSASGGNEQPWKFGIITDKDLIKKISEAASVNYDQSWIANAPLIIVLCTQIFDYTGSEVGMKRFPSYHERIHAIDRDLFALIDMEEHQTKIPGEHMVLAALEHGIYSTWVSSIDCEKVGQLLGIDGYWVSNIIVFGYPKTIREVTPKKNTEDIAFTNSFMNSGITL
jgi:nitroreductase